MSMKCKGAIFDMDGLLFDTEVVFQETWKEIADERNVKLPDEFTEAISGTSGQHMCDVLSRYYGVEDGSEIMHDCMSRVRRKLEIEVVKKEGVDEILECLKEKGIHIAVASSSSREQIESNLKKAGIYDCFEQIVCGKDVTNGKPAPDIFLLAAEKIGCRPEECYVFEDSENGIRAGSSAGCHAIMIPDMIKPSEEMRRLSAGIYDSLLEAKKVLFESV